MKNLLDIGISARGFVETEELQKIIDRAESGETIFFGSSKNGDGEEYAILQPLVIRKSITIEGDNPTVRIKQWGNNPTFVIQPDLPDQVIVIKNIHIESGSIGIQVSSSHRLSELSEIRNVKFTAQSTASIKFESPDVNIAIKNINVYGSYDGLWLSSSTAFNKLSIEDSVFKSIQNRAISLNKAISSFSGNVSLDKVGIFNSKDSLFLNNFIVTGSNTFFENVQQTVISSGSSAFVSPGAGGGGRPTNSSRFYALIRRNGCNTYCYNKLCRSNVGGRQVQV